MDVNLSKSFVIREGPRRMFHSSNTPHALPTANVDLAAAGVPRQIRLKFAR